MKPEAMAALAAWIRAESGCAAYYARHGGKTERYKRMKQHRLAAMEKFWEIVK